jgi:hemolysin D
MKLRLRTLALIDLGQRYQREFAVHWRNRNQELPKRYRASEAEFLPASLALIEKPVSPTARATGLLLTLLLLSAILWSLASSVDIVVKATGKIVPSGRTKSIASVDVASVRAIHVVEGQSVHAGDVLIELDAGAFEADERKAESALDAARLEMARSRALIAAIDTGRAPVLAPIRGISGEAFTRATAHLSGQYRDYLAKLTQLEGEIERYSGVLNLAQDRARKYADLARTQDVSADSASEKLQAAVDLEGQLAEARNARWSHIADTRRQAFESLTDAGKVVASATEDAARAVSHARLLTLRAPVDGFVQQLTVHTTGGVVPMAQSLLSIVPREDGIEVEGYVDDKDIGFVREGQSAEVKVDAFDYTRHGMIHGWVESVSKDAIDADDEHGPTYRAKIRLDHPFILIDGRPVRLTAGMSVSVEIKTGTRRVIEYVLSPLLKYRRESLHER